MWYHHRLNQDDTLFDFPVSDTFKRYEDEARFLILGRNYSLEKSTPLASEKREPTKTQDVKFIVKEIKMQEAQYKGLKRGKG